MNRWLPILLAAWLLAGCATTPPATVGGVLSPTHQAARVEQAQDLFMWGAVGAGFLAAVAFGAAAYFREKSLAVLALALAVAMVALGVLAVAFGWAIILGGLVLLIGGVGAILYGLRHGWWEKDWEASVVKLVKEGNTKEAVAVLRTKFPGLQSAFQRRSVEEKR